MFVSPSRASKFYNVSKETLRLWAISGKIKTNITPGGHHRYEIISKTDDLPTRKKIIYARVSSSKQKDDLERQIQFIQHKYNDYEIIKDIGSGFNFERPGFLSLMEQIFQGNIQQVVIAHPDRITRIGFSFIQKICRHFNTKLTVLSNKKDKSPEEEFTEDFISVITFYTSKFYGMRKYKIF